MTKAAKQQAPDEKLVDYVRRMLRTPGEGPVSIPSKVPRNPGEDMADYLRRIGVDVLNYSRRGAASPEEGARTDIIWNAKSLDEVLKIAERRFGNKGKPK